MQISGGSRDSWTGLQREQINRIWVKHHARPEDQAIVILQAGGHGKVHKVKKTMKCERCKTVVPEGEQRALHGQILCEDCYMDLLSPLRVCDPWAVHSAMTFVKGAAADLKLTPVQQKIVDILQHEGPQEPENLCERLQIKETEYLTSTFDILFFQSFFSE